jgi:hypothetical protein
LEAVAELGAFYFGGALFLCGGSELRAERLELLLLSGGEGGAEQRYDLLV